MKLFQDKNHSSNKGILLQCLLKQLTLQLVQHQIELHNIAHVCTVREWTEVQIQN